MFDKHTTQKNCTARAIKNNYSENSWVVVNKTFYNPLNGYNYFRKSPKKKKIIIFSLKFSHQI